MSETINDAKQDRRTSLLELDRNSSDKTDSSKEHSSQSQDRRHYVDSVGYDRCQKQNTIAQVRMLNSRVDKRVSRCHSLSSNSGHAHYKYFSAIPTFHFLFANPTRTLLADGSYPGAHSLKRKSVLHLLRPYFV